jgi:hypothetical protein
MQYLTTYQMRISFHIVDNIGIISQVEWHVKTRQNQDILEAKMLKYQRIARGQTTPIRRLDAGTM